MTNSSRLQKRKAEALLDLFGKKAFLANGKCYPKTKSSAPSYNVYSLKLPEAMQKDQQPTRQASGYEEITTHTR